MFKKNTHTQLLAEQGSRSELAKDDAALQTEAGIFPQGAVFSPLIPCSQACGELYCSPSCRDEHWARGHRLLCVGPIPDDQAATHPLVLFKMHAVRTNEIFLLVADVVALILTQFEATGGVDLAGAMAPFRDFVQHPWWEVATNPDPGSDPVAFQAMLKGLVQEASQLLGLALLGNGGSAGGSARKQEMEQLFTPDFFAAVIGMFEQNNVGIRRQSPLPAFVANQLVPLCGGVHQQQQQQQQYMSQVYLPLLAQVFQDWDDGDDDEDEDEEEEGEEECMAVDESNDCNGGCGDGGGCHNAGDNHNHEHAHAHTPQEREVPSFSSPIELLDACLAKSRTSGIFSALDGTALLSLICCMNHSCAPNCEVRWVGGEGEGGKPGGSTPLLAELVALEPIPAGAELFQSYVKVENTTTEERREKLKDYGFLCQCPKCGSV